MNGIIYKVKNNITGKYYIGQTIKNIERRKNEHIVDAKSGRGYRLHSSIRKYGIDVFSWEILCICCSLDDLITYEDFYIHYYNSQIPYGYNISGAKSGTYTRTDEIKKKMSKAKIGNISPMFGKSHTEETRKKISDNHIDVSGNKNPNFGNRKEKSYWWGKKHKPETIEKMKLSAKRRGKE